MMTIFVIKIINLMINRIAITAVVIINKYLNY